uniref:Uncharacterized protein n=1 Tax=Setaria digitata TaxID=48799 RepID=A0A915PLT2_9BILA
MSDDVRTTTTSADNMNYSFIGFTASPTLPWDTVPLLACLTPFPLPQAIEELRKEGESLSSHTTALSSHLYRGTGRGTGAGKLRIPLWVRAWVSPNNRLEYHNNLKEALEKEE